MPTRRQWVAVGAAACSGAWLHALLDTRVQQLEKLQVELLEAQALIRTLQAATVTSRSTGATGATQTSSSCQTRCDSDCSRFDRCQGEAWVCVNLFELLGSDSGPLLLGDRNRQCHAPLRRSLRMEMQQLLRRRVATAARINPDAVDTARPLHTLATYEDVQAQDLQFQSEAEALYRQQGSPRRVPHNYLSDAITKRRTMDDISGELSRGECQQSGIRLPHLARSHFFNASRWTFNTENMHQDAVLFMLDLLFQQRALFNRLSWLGTLTEQDPFDAIILQELIVRLKPDLIIETGTYQGGSALVRVTCHRWRHPGAPPIWRHTHTQCPFSSCV